jgi:hypothetical protein
MGGLIKERPLPNATMKEFGYEVYPHSAWVNHVFACLSYSIAVGVNKYLGNYSVVWWRWRGNGRWRGPVGEGPGVIVGPLPITQHERLSGAPL